MKKISVLLFMLFITTPSFASWYYLVDSNNIVRCKQNGPARQENLEIDEMIQIKSEEDIELLQAEYRGGKIVVHKKTAAELKAEDDVKLKNSEEKLIQDKMRALAIAELKKEGVELKQVKD